MSGCCCGCFYCAAVLSVEICLPRSLAHTVDVVSVSANVSVSLSNAKIPLPFCWLSFHFPARLFPRPASCLFRFAVYFRNFIIAFGWVATVCWLFALCLWGLGQRVVLATWPGHLEGILEWDSERKRGFLWGMDFFCAVNRCGWWESRQLLTLLTRIISYLKWPLRIFELSWA